MSDLELYIHIPFCIKKCNYCDFLSAPGNDDEIEKYVEALIREIKACARDYAGFNITSVFIGGGTPSILKNEQFVRLADALNSVWNLKGTKGKNTGVLARFFKRKAVRPEIEFTVECNPGTVDLEKLRTLKKIGVNRLSIGAQSVLENELKELGRIHSSDDFIKSFNEARLAGFNNINVDLMQAIPLQTRESWRKNIMSVAALRPEHISAYSLIIEEGTPFFERMNSDFPLALPDEDTEREIYLDTRTLLKQFGYHRYEISNYALDGYECEHNKGYWQRKNYLGLGLGASSMVNNIRWKNTDKISEYVDNWTKENSGSETLLNLRREIEKLSKKDQMAEYMFLGLRLSEGICKETFTDTFGVSYDYIYGEITEKLIKDGLLEVVERPKKHEDENETISFNDADDTETYVFLTDYGVDVSNRVFAEFMS